MFFFKMMDDEMVIFRLLSLSSGAVMWDGLKCEAVVETRNLGRRCIYGICRDKKEKGREMYEAFWSIDASFGDSYRWVQISIDLQLKVEIPAIACFLIPLFIWRSKKRVSLFFWCRRCACLMLLTKKTSSSPWGLQANWRGHKKGSSLVPSCWFRSRRSDPSPWVHCMAYTTKVEGQGQQEPRDLTFFL